MTEGSQPSSAAPSPDDGATGSPVAPSGAGTVEEVEAIWRNRFSARDRAHNAEVESLQRQMDALRTQNSTPPGVPEDPNAARVRELEAQLASERTGNALKAKYPDAAAVLGDDIVRLAEEKIAAVNAGFSQQQPPPPVGGPPIIDPNQPPIRPPGSPGGPKRPEDMEPDELKDQLRGLEPAYREMISNR